MAECLVIGLDEQHFSNFCKRNEPTGIDFKTFPRRQRRSAGSHTKRCGFAWSGLLNASDRSGWRQCLSRGEVLAVFEDGARLRDDFETQLQTLLQRVTGWDLILFGCNMDTGIELAVTPHVSLKDVSRSLTRSSSIWRNLPRFGMRSSCVGYCLPLESAGM